MSFTTNLENFLDNNQPGGYITTSINISNTDLEARITQAINNRGFLTSNSHIPWNNIDNRPTLFSGSYNDLADKPALFSGSYNDLSNKPTLFSGDYNDLSNKPTININNTLPIGQRIATINNIDINAPIVTAQSLGLSATAVSNDYMDLINRFYSIDFGEFIYKQNNDTYSILDTNSTDYNILTNCGTANGYVKNINLLYDSDNENNVNLINKLLLLQQAFANGQFCYLKHNNAYHLITEIIPYYENDEDLIGLIINCVMRTHNNYFVDLINTSSITTDQEIENILNSIITSSFTPMIIVDIKYNILYSLVRQDYPITSNNFGIYIDQKYNGVGAQISTKANNKLQIITTDGEEGLYVGP